MNHPIESHPSLQGSRAALLAVALSAALMAPLPAGAQDSPPGENAAALTDANIAAIVLAANTIDIKNGQLALAKSKNRSVKGLANQMVTDHTSVNAKATALAGRLNLVPQENQSSQALVASADLTRTKMRKLSGGAFDRAYVSNEVAYHQAVIELLDGTIVPSAENQELKELLVSVRPAFLAHLEHAKMVQASLKK